MIESLVKILQTLQGINRTNKEIALAYIWGYLGKWYKWGGDDPSGFDCSGLAIEYLKAAGLLARKSDTTADGLWRKFEKQRVKNPYRGCLVFWQRTSDPAKASHIEIMLNNKLAIGASGGGSKTLTIADAINQNAFIKVRDIYSRNNILGFIDPFKS